MTDPFRDQTLRERRTRIAGLAVLGFLLASIALLLFSLNSGERIFMTGEVVRFGSYADETGDHHLVLVRMPDGIVRQLFIRRDQVWQCKTGDRIEVLSVGNTYRVGLRGCAGSDRGTVVPGRSSSRT
jgi:hypothetical protein